MLYLCRVSLGSESGIYEFLSGKLLLREIGSRNYEWESGASRQHPEFPKNMAAEYDLEGKILQSVYALCFSSSVIFLLVDSCVGLNWFLVSILSHVN